MFVQLIDTKLSILLVFTLYY